MKCSICGKDIRNETPIITTDGKVVCSRCCSENYNRCSVCGGWVPKPSGLCDECKDVVFKRTINPYSTKVTGIFKNRVGDSTECLNNRYFGYEMEFSNIDPTAAKYSFKEYYDNKMIYNKSDSSLYGGVEIVSIPMTRNHIFKLIDGMDFDTFKKFKDGNLYKNAGVHIHVSRNTITPIDITKLSLLFNGKSSYKYKKYIYYIVGRMTTHEFENDYSIDDGYFGMGRICTNNVGKKDYCSTHGISLNLGNKDTIEFRMFKSTTDKEQLKSYLIFVEKAIEFVEKNSLNMISIPNFITYLDLTVCNKYMRGVLDTIRKANPDLFGIKKIDYSINKYIDALKDIPSNRIDEVLGDLEVSDNKYIDWDKRLTVDDVKYYASYGTGYYNTIVDKIRNVIKERAISKILDNKGVVTCA